MPDSQRTGGRIAAAISSPVVQTDVLQMVKAALAAVVAWLLADAVLGLQQSFLAPWVALLTVHATVHRTLWRGGQTILAVGIGILLAFVTVQTLGASGWSLGLSVLAGLVLARLRWVYTEGVTVATTALFVILTGEDTSTQAALQGLPDRLLATGAGVAVALLINLVVLPPLNDRSAQRQVDDVDRLLGGLLQDMADQLARGDADDEEADWIERTRALDRDIEHAWSLVRHSQESRRLNPRGRRWSAEVPRHYGEVLVRLEEGVSQTRSMARHLRESQREAHDWGAPFRERWVPLLAELGRRVADPEQDVADLREDLDHLVGDLTGDDLDVPWWPLYGALLANTRMIIDVVDDVATASPVRT